MINENKHFINRKIMLIKQGHTVRTLSKAVGLTVQAVNPAINGTSTSYRCHSRIAAVLGKPMVEIWPELYGIVPVLDCDENPTSVFPPGAGADKKIGRAVDRG